MNLLRSLLIGTILAATAMPAIAADTALRIMSFNIRLPAESDGVDYWETRKPLAVRMLREQLPDVIGMQELVKTQAEYLAQALPQYAWFGRGREADGSGERMGVFYRKDRLTVIESGDFWLSDTPEVPGSITWHHLYPRMVTWALFERRSDGKRFYLFNTHLPYREQDEAARVKGVEAIAQRLATLPADVPVVLTGDFNTTPDSDVHAVLARALQDAWTTAPRVDGSDATFHGFTGQADKRIDWIFVRGVQLDSITSVTTRWNGRYPSDHFPLVVTLRLP
ncbi:endonuclease/exonuclease/phosphatase family metal-dependent hydrolase [Pseudoxanthomonas japonensis]|uniref:endonuclease/exonuclease/phosphatase family protein n=1 Tax=Pseudoxanthomonas japonensis TaxID=69284 RepID=UPI0028555E8C|nr:endonuclease/exonuclease/phosphatase family protein [Pseudoxanthomonas japonensis]MDR7068508.1 endonuclease/exonuclease/phosphatase family metal-dependent hydrolase [Pseudoxanthomonas japonensis]